MPLSKTQCAELLGRLPAVRQQVRQVLTDQLGDLPGSTCRAIKAYLLGRIAQSYRTTVTLQIPALVRTRTVRVNFYTRVGFDSIWAKSPSFPGEMSLDAAVTNCSLNDAFRYDVGVAKVLKAYISMHFPKWNRDRRKRFVDLNTPILMAAINEGIATGWLPTQEELS